MTDRSADDSPARASDVCSVPRISVVIPAWNGCATIAACLRSVTRATDGKSVEILVVESSGDAARDLISREFPNVRLLLPNRRMQVGQARNLGLENATGDLVFFVDQDCTVPADWIEHLGQLFTDPTIGAVGGSVGVGNPRNLSGMGVYFLEFFRHIPSQRPACECHSFLLGCNLAVRRCLYPNVRFPDQTLGEDVLFSDAIRRTGQRLIYSPAVRVSHWNRTGWREFFRYTWKMGVASAEYQRVLQVSHIRIFLRYPVLVLLTPPINCMRVLWQLISARSEYLLLFLLLLLPCIVGNTWWAIAFYGRTATLSRKISRALNSH